jgi:hypothetical protein
VIVAIVLQAVSSQRFQQRTPYETRVRGSDNQIKGRGNKIKGQGNTGSGNGNIVRRGNWN